MQGRNKGFSRADKISWNEGALTNILSTTPAHQFKSPKGNILDFSLLDALKTAFLMKYLTHRSTQSGYFFLKLRKFFSIFKK